MNGEIYAHTDYRSYLRSILAQKIETNPSYSLRALARQLKLQPSNLSEVLQGKKNFSSEAALKVSEHLGLAGIEREFFCTLVEFEAAKNSAVKLRAFERLQTLAPQKPIHNLSIDAFRSLSEWYHLPILEMTSLPAADFTPQRIASRLGITAIEAQAAIERLERLELITRKGTKYIRTQARFQAASGVPSEALRKFHKQMLQKAQIALETQHPSERVVGSETFAGNAKQLKKANDILEKCFSDILKVFTEDDSSRKSEIYHLGIQLFRLTDSESEKSS